MHLSDQPHELFEQLRDVFSGGLYQRNGFEVFTEVRRVYFLGEDISLSNYR
jgi:hypothetical protein